MRLGAWLFLFCTSRRLIRPEWTVTYQGQHLTINSSISECHHNVKPETQNRRLEPTGLPKPGKTRGLAGPGPGLARHESAGRVFGWFGNRTDLFVQSKPGPLAGYPDPLLTLGTCRVWVSLGWTNPGDILIPPSMDLGSLHQIRGKAIYKHRLTDTYRFHTCHDHQLNTWKGCMGIVFFADNEACHIVNTELKSPQISSYPCNQLLTGIGWILPPVNIYISGRIQSFKLLMASPKCSSVTGRLQECLRGCGV